MDINESTSDKIKLEIKRELPDVNQEIQSWVVSHLIEPQPIQLATEADGGGKKEFWLITDETGDNDSSYRIVYDPREKKFGLEMTLETGTQLYLGPYGSFSKAANRL